MSGRASRQDVPETISRQALGRIAGLGALYDATTDKFCGVSAFRQQLPPDCPAISRTDSPQSNIKFTVVSSLQEKLKNLNVTGALQLSVLGGLFEVTGSARYLSHEKNSFKSVESTLLYNIKTVTEHLELSYDEVRDYISQEAMRNSGATHVVIEIEWGANCVITVTDQNSENKNNQEVKGNLKLHVDKLKALVSLTGEAAVEMKNALSDEWKKFSLEIFGDLVPEGSDEFPQTFDGALALMRKVPELVQSYNDGKGKPLSYVMLPVSYLASEKPSLPIETLQWIDETWGLKIVHLFDRIIEFKQIVYDQFDEMNNYRDCVTTKQLQEMRRLKNDLEVQEASAKGELAQLLESVRSAKDAVVGLDSFCDKHYKTSSDKFHECGEIFEAAQARIEFRKRCERYGAKYLAPPVEQRIAGAGDDYDDVYVLFHGEADRETTARNEAAFIELAKESQNDTKTVCYTTWSNQSGNIAIKHFRKGQLVHDDVAKQLEAKDMARCVPAARPTFYLLPFRARCPGSFDEDCGKEERTWTCINCNETLQLCPSDRALYCHCGRSLAKRFQFHCSSNAHGSAFKHFNDDALNAAIDQHKSAACRDADVVKTISTDGVPVRGMTSVDDELFALLWRDDNQVAVYSINDYQLLRHIHWPGLKRDSDNDLTSCVRHKCLYASDWHNKCIHRYDLSSSAVSKWSVPDPPWGLSVTPGSGNLLVACKEPSKLVELRADSGQLVRQITLQSDIKYLYHAVQLTTGEHVVCHGAYGTLHRVCLVDVEGRVTRSYGGQRGRGVGQLAVPWHLAVDEDSQFIFVADWGNDRVVLLSPTLEFVRQFSEGVSGLWRLYFHQTTRRLFVGQCGGGDITVIQL